MNWKGREVTLFMKINSLPSMAISNLTFTLKACSTLLYLEGCTSKQSKQCAIQRTITQAWDQPGDARRCKNQVNPKQHCAGVRFLVAESRQWAKEGGSCRPTNQRERLLQLYREFAAMAVKPRCSKRQEFVEKMPRMTKDSQKPNFVLYFYVIWAINT